MMSTTPHVVGSAGAPTGRGAQTAESCSAAAIWGDRIAQIRQRDSESAAPTHFGKVVRPVTS
jgi:hypothetical protein